MEPAQLTAAKPPVLDKLTAAIAGAITLILAIAAAAGWIPAVNLPPEAILGAVTAIVTIGATIRGMREGKSSAATAALVSDLVAQVNALREQVGAAAVTTPVGEPPKAPAVPFRIPISERTGGDPVKRQGGRVSIDALCCMAGAVIMSTSLAVFACDGSTVGPGLVDVLSRVDARTVVRCAEQEGAGAKAACLGAAVATPALQVLLERARQAVQNASLVGPGGAGADDATDEDRKRAARDLDAALDALSAEVARTHGGSP